MSEVRVGLAGCGGMGRGLVSQLVTIEGVKFAAGADPAEASREIVAKDYGVPTYASLGEMLDKAELDGVIVASPNRFHCPNVLEVAAAGKHVFCEKPMALTLEDCQAMIDACASAGVRLQIGQVLRYLPNFAYAIEQVRAGAVGEAKHGMIFRYSPPKADWNQTWRDDPAVVGHYIFEVAVHEIDLARQLFGKPVAVSGWDQNFNPDSPLWAQATSWVIEFESGAVCLMVEGMFNALGRTEVEIAGTGGAMRFTWGGANSYKALDAEAVVETPANVIAEGRENGLRRELREWVEAFVQGKPCTIPGEEGKANIEVALAALESSKRKARVALPL